MDEQSTLERLERLGLEVLSRAVGKTAKNQLGLEAPFERNVEHFAGLLVRQRVVVLQIAAEALSLERGPQHVLVHGRGVLRPLWELVGVLRHLAL